MNHLAEITVPASTETIEAVVGVFEQILQRHPVLPDEDFFDLGGDSLLAIQLFAELERVTGQRLPITTIYDASTPALLSELLGPLFQDRPAFSPLVLLNDAPGGPPVFLVHGIGGHVMELKPLGRHIEATRRVFALQARGLDGIEQPIDSVAEMAEYYLSHVRREQPEGPYVFVGYSFGGMVALEMARLVRAAGQQVAFLGFIDAYPHSTKWPWRSWVDVRCRRALHGARSRLWGKMPRLMAALDRKGAAASGGPNALVRPFMFDEDWPEAVKKVYDVSLDALSRYEPRPYDGPVVFFRARVRSFYLPNDPVGMWGRLISNFRVVTVPGDHMEMVDQKATFLGTELGRFVQAGLAHPQSPPSAPAQAAARGAEAASEPPPHADLVRT